MRVREVKIRLVVRGKLHVDALLEYIGCFAVVIVVVFVGKILLE